MMDGFSDQIKDKVRDLNREIREIDLLNFCISKALTEHSDAQYVQVNRSALVELLRKNNMRDRMAKHIRKTLCDAHGLEYWRI